MAAKHVNFGSDARDRTELTEKAREEIPGLHERVLARIPQGRWAKPTDMAGTAVWLASAASDSSEVIDSQTFSGGAAKRLEYVKMCGAVVKKPASADSRLNRGMR